MCVSPPSLCVETSFLMLCYLRVVPWEVIISWGWSPSRMSSLSLYKDTTGSSLAPLLCEDTAERWLSMNPEAGPDWTPNLPAPWSWTSQPSKLWETRFCRLWAAQSLAFCYSILKGLLTLFSFISLKNDRFPTNILIQIINKILPTINYKL